MTSLMRKQAGDGVQRLSHTSIENTGASGPGRQDSAKEISKADHNAAIPSTAGEFLADRGSEKNAEAAADLKAARKNLRKSSTRRTSLISERMGAAGEDGEETGRLLLDPKSPFLKHWDSWTGILLVFTAIVTPWEVAFLQDVTTYEGSFIPLYAVNRLVDLTFIIDLVMQFFLPFIDSTTGAYVLDRSLIVSRYLRTWFLLDFVSVLPFDIIEPITGADTSDLKIMRLVRLLRLMKLLRLLRSSRMFQRWESSMEIDYSMLDLQKFVILVVFVAHLLACGWRLLIEEVDTAALPEDNWIANYSGLMDVNNRWSLYLAALYWAVATLSTLGYGDVLPMNDGERTYVVFCTVLGGSIYAYMVGAVCGLVSSMNEENALFYKTIDQLNSFMREKAFEQGLKERLREYFRFKRTFGQTDTRHELLKMMSDQLRAEVAEHVHAKWINTVSFFRGCPQEFYTELALQLRTELYSASEYIIKENDHARTMFIIEKGLVGSQGRILSVGKAFGVDMIGSSPHRRRNYTAMTLANSALLTLSKEHMEAILVNYPNVQKKLRHEVVRTLCREAILMYTRAVLKLSGIAQQEGGDLLADDFDPYSIHPDLLGMLLEHRIKAMQKEKPDDYAEMNNAALTVQKNIKMINIRSQVRSELDKRKQMTREQTMLVDLLVRLGMSQYRKQLVEMQKLDIVLFRCLSPGDLYTAAAVPLGDAVKMLKEAKSSVNMPADLIAAGSGTAMSSPRMW